MATYNTTIAPLMTTDAEFRTMVAAIRDGIEQVLTRAGDTGQIDTATVTLPSFNAAAGYNIYRLPGGTQDVYLKLEYGRANSNDPAVWVTFGTTTDGAGTLGGATTTRRMLSGGGSTTAYTCLFTADTGRFAMVLWDNHTNIQGRFVVSFERDHLIDGTDNEDYYFACYFSDASLFNARFHRCVRVVGDQWREMTTLVGTWPSGSSGVIGLDVAGWPVRPIYATERNPSRNWHVVMAADVSAGTIFTADLYGETHTWIRTNIAPSYGDSRSSTHVLCMRWD